MNAPERARPAASNALGATEQVCETCGSPFTAKRGWARFCTTRCRNAHHAAEARVEKIQAKALEMYEALVVIARGHNDPIGVNSDLATSVIKDLKPPVEPKALLEKAKA